MPIFDRITGQRDWDEERRLRSEAYWRKHPIGSHPGDFVALAEAMADLIPTREEAVELRRRRINTAWGNRHLDDSGVAERDAKRALRPEDVET